jgi:hypothetical protein
LVILPSYYARHVASGYRTIWRYGCSYFMDFNTFLSIDEPCP